MHPDAEEDLPEPRRSALTRTPGRRRALAGAAAVLLAGAVGLRLASSGGDAPQRRPAASPLALPSVRVLPGPIGTAVPAPVGGTYDPTACPNALPCNVADVLPASVLTALREAVPGAVLLGSHTVGYFLGEPRRNGLWYRQLEARGGGFQIRVLVERAAPRRDSTPQERVDRSPAETVGFVRVGAGAFAVSVRFTGSAGAAVPMGELRALAADPRLLSLG